MMRLRRLVDTCVKVDKSIGPNQGCLLDGFCMNKHVSGATVQYANWHCPARTVSVAFFLLLKL